MGFGVGSAGKISQDTNYSVQVAEKADENGVITDMTTYGGKKEVTTTEFADAGGTNTAVNGQSGATDIVTAFSEKESNTEYSQLTVTKVSALGASA